MALLNEDDDGNVTATSVRDRTVEEVAEEMRKAPSTVRGWLLSGDLRGYKFHREWRIPRSALRDYLTAQAATSVAQRDTGEVGVCMKTPSGSATRNTDLTEPT